MQKILVTLNCHFLSYYYSKPKLLFQQKIMFSWKMLHIEHSQSSALYAIFNHSEKNVTHTYLLLKRKGESICLQQSAQSTHEMSQNPLCLIITFPSSFTLLPFLPVSSFFNPFLKPCSQIEPRSNPSTRLTSLNVSVYYLTAPSAWLCSFYTKSQQFSHMGHTEPSVRIGKIIKGQAPFSQF